MLECPGIFRAAKCTCARRSNGEVRQAPDKCRSQVRRRVLRNDTGAYKADRRCCASTQSGRRTVRAITVEEQAAEVEPVPFEQRSRFSAKIAKREFVTSVEIVPPKGCDASKMLEGVRILKAAGVDAVNVPDGPRAQSRMGALAVSLLIEQHVGIEAVTHYACRDRNLLGMFSDLLGAAGLGLRNFLLRDGRSPKDGPLPGCDCRF